MTETALDIVWLEEEYDEDLKTVCHIYIEENDKELILLKSNFDHGNISEVQANAHKIKGSSRIIKANQLIEIAEKIETATTSGNMDLFISQLETEYHKVRNILYQYLKK